MTQSPFHGQVRIGLAEDVVDARLLRALHGFGADYPGMGIDVHVNIPGTLLALLKQGALDVVIGSLCETQDPGTLLWSEPLVWACLEQPFTALREPLPLALFPEPCAYREAALLKLAQAGIAQRTAMLCTSINALRCAVLSGFAIAPLPMSQLGPGLTTLSPEHGLPVLPDAEFRLFTSHDADQEIVRTISQLIVEYCVTRRA
jgi:DNA-binding transcriptional LysR family regulator